MELCLDVGGTAIKYALFSGDAIVQAGEAQSGPEGAEVLLERLVALVKKYNPAAVGVDICGMTEHGVVHLAGNLGILTDYPLAANLSHACGVPVFIENDVNAAALGEAYYGAAKNEQDFLCLALGTGVGGAFFTNGRLVRGGHGMAGEVGHLTLHPGGIPCTCGKNGCMERYASASALVEAARQADATITSGRDFFAKLNSSVALQQVFAAWLSEAALGIASLVHVLDPSVLVLCGGICEQTLVVDGLHTALQQTLLPPFRSLRLRQAVLGNLSGVYGMLARCRGLGE